MAFDKFSEAKLTELNEEAGRLEKYCEAQSEAVKIDFRRRYDQAVAVLRPARANWIRIDAITEQEKRLRNSKWRKAEVALFFGGAAVSWWLSSDGTTISNLGTGMMAFAALSYIGFLVTAHYVRGELSDLERRQDDYLYKWEASGADSQEFWGHRDRTCDEVKLEELSEPERGKAEKELEIGWYVLRHRLRQALFYRASGTRPGFSLKSGEHLLEQDSW